MDRIQFLESVKGIKYPEMIVSFFDHFIALKQIVDDTGKITVIDDTNEKIIFSIDFKSKEYFDKALNIINSLCGNINIYGRNVSILVKPLTDSSLQIKLE